MDLTEDKAEWMGMRPDRMSQPLIESTTLHGPEYGYQGGSIWTGCPKGTTVAATPRPLARCTPNAAWAGRARRQICCKTPVVLMLAKTYACMPSCYVESDPHD